MCSRKKIKILVCYHKKAKLFKNDILVPIHCGREVAFQKSKDGMISKKDYNWLKKNTIGDNTGNHVSHLNRQINEMTAIYWAWKNYDKLGNPDYIGLMHYRRLFDLSYLFANKKNNIEKMFQEEYLNNIIDKYDVICQTGKQITKPWLHNFEQYQEFVNLSEKNHPLLYQQYLKFKEKQTFYFNNMFILKKEDFFNMCEEIFPLILKLCDLDQGYISKKWYEYAKENLPQEDFKVREKIYKNNDEIYPRLIGFVSEYLTCFYMYYLISKYIDRVLYLPVKMIKDKSSSGKIFSITKSDKNRVCLTFLGIKFLFKIRNKENM